MVHENFFTEGGDRILMKELTVARGLKKADLVLKNGNVINVFTETVEHADVAVCNGLIAGIGEYEGEKELDCTGKYIAPGLIDGHIHLESSMLKPVEFAKVVLPHGTTAVITDPHEIANVCGLDGIRYMMEASRGLPLDVYFGLPSCVPATSFDENGYKLKAEDMESFYGNERVLGLAEVMDYIGTIQGDSEILKKINGSKSHHKIVDGHAPGLHGKDVCAYLMAGVNSDHECASLEEAMEKLSLGQWIMVREGTAARNLQALLGMFKPPYYQRAMLVTDDKHPHDLLKYGHIDAIIRMAVERGADPCIAIKMATFNTASYFGLRDMGAVAPGYQADMVILSDLAKMQVDTVIKNGKIVFHDHKTVDISEPYVSSDLFSQVHNSFHVRKLIPSDFVIPPQQNGINSGTFRVIQLIPGEIYTKETRVPLIDGKPGVSIQEDILKLACIERHHNTGHIGIGFVRGYGLKKGAVASSVSHDSHNIIVVGANDDDIAAAAECIREMQGGWAIAENGRVTAKLPLPIAGLMSELDAEAIAVRIDDMKRRARKLGAADGIDPFMTLAFVSLPVIPELRLITTGLFDVERQEIVPIVSE